MQKGAKISFAERRVDILLKSGAKLQANADAQGLFYVPFSADFQFALITAEPPMDQLWHQRFGYIGATALDKMPDLVIGISEKDTGYAPKNLYEACIKGKFTANPNHGAAETHYTEYGNHMSSDLCGPISKTAYQGIKYFDTLLDTATKWLDIRLLKTKKEALRAFKLMKTAAETQSGKKIKILRTDWGKEFVNTEFNTFLTECGILHQHSAPYAHEQNGLAERVNRTILEKARCLMFQCGLSTKYWPLAVEAAIYLYNRTWHSAIGKTPYEARFGRKPHVENIRLFGSIAYVKNNKPQKLQERASFRGILIGFGENQYKILNPDSDKIYWSRDVEVLEGKYYSSRNSVEGGYLDFNQMFENAPNSTNAISENPSETTGSPNPSELSEDMDHVTPDQPQNFDTNPDSDSSEDELIRTYISIDRSKTPDPATFKELQDSPNAKQWIAAMEKEMQDLAAENIWKLVNLPPNRKALKGRWVFKIKIGANGEIEKYKA